MSRSWAVAVQASRILAVGGTVGPERPAAQGDGEAGAVLGVPGNVFLQKNTV